MHPINLRLLQLMMKTNDLGLVSAVSRRSPSSMKALPGPGQTSIPAPYARRMAQQELTLALMALALKKKNALVRLPRGVKETLELSDAYLEEVTRETLAARKSSRRSWSEPGGDKDRERPFLIQGPSEAA